MTEPAGQRTVRQHRLQRLGRHTAFGGQTGNGALNHAAHFDGIGHIGKDKGGAGADEIAEKIMAAVTDQIGGFVSGLDLTSVFEGMETVPDALQDLAGGAMEQVESVTEGVTEGVTETLDEAIGENAGDVLGDGATDATDGVGDAIEGVGDAVDDLLGQ